MQIAHVYKGVDPNTCIYKKKILHNYENHDMMYTKCIIYEIASYNKLG